MPAKITLISHFGEIIQRTILLIVLLLGFAPRESTAQSISSEPVTTATGATPNSGPNHLPSATSARNKDISQTSKSKAKYDISRIGDRGIGHGLDFYSAEQERQLGEELANAIESSSRLIADPVVNEYLNRLGLNIVQNSDCKIPFVIKVLDDDDLNAFALPGGFLYINRGLILAADNEAELVAAMAHEVGHVAARHGTKNATRAQIFDAASMSLILVGGPVGLAVRGLAGLARPMTYMKFSRDAEREADLLGLEYQYTAGYDPQEFIAFFETMGAGETQKRSLINKAFATHPMTVDRIKLAQQEIATYLPDRAEYIIDTSEFQEIKARLSSGEGRLPKLRRPLNDVR